MMSLTMAFGIARKAVRPALLVALVVVVVSAGRRASTPSTHQTPAATYSTLTPVPTQYVISTPQPNAYSPDRYAAMLASCQSDPNGATIHGVDTSRRFITLPRALYGDSRFVTVSGTAGAGYAYLAGPLGNSHHTAECWTNYFEFVGHGAFDFEAKSIVPGWPDYVIHFNVTGPIPLLCLLDAQQAGTKHATIDWSTREVSVKDGSDVQVVMAAGSPGSSYAYTAPALAPSGAVVVLGANMRVGETSQPGLWQLRADGGPPQLLFATDNGASFEAEDPAFSPDGTRIAFTYVHVHQLAPHGLNFRYEIWVMNANGSSPHKVADGQHPLWSMDGRYIAYSQGVTGAQALIDPNTFMSVQVSQLQEC